MNLDQVFEICHGTTVGAEHIGSGGVLAGGTNQDSFAVKSHDGCIAAVICDGCSDRPDSGVGANLLAKLFTKEALLLSKQKVKPREFVRQLNSQISRGILTLAETVATTPDEVKAIIDQLFLATIVGAVVLPQRTLIIAAGDGMWGINDSIETLGPFPKNEPPYLAYSLRDKNRPDAQLELVTEIETTRIHSLFLGSDGCGALSDLRRYWTEDRFFSNPALLSRDLRMQNQESFSFSTEQHSATQLVVRPSWSERKLADDTTLVCLRRKRRPEPPVKHAPGKRSALGGLLETFGLGGSTSNPASITQTTLPPDDTTKQ